MHLTAASWAVAVDPVGCATDTNVQSRQGGACDVMSLATSNVGINMTRQTSSLDLAGGRRILEAGERKAAEIKIPYNIAVADSGGNLLAHIRMDGAWLGSVDIAINKAWTARAFDMSTDDLSRITQPGQQGFGINTTNDSRVVIFGGGI